MCGGGINASFVTADTNQAGEKQVARLGRLFLGQDQLESGSHELGDSGALGFGKHFGFVI